MLIIAIIFEVAGTLMLKKSDGWQVWQWGMGAVLLYSLAGMMLAYCLKYMSVGLAYAIWAGSGIALVCLASALLWQQRLDVPALGGIACIVVGVWLITLKSAVVLQ